MCGMQTVYSLLLSLIFPMGESGMTAEQKAAFSEAAAIQTEFERDGGGDTVKSRSVGDVSVTYADQSGLAVNGRRIAPEAAALLKNAGLLCRWF